MEQDIEFGNSVERKLYAWAESRLMPIYGVLELTPLCNMNCDMCYVRLSKGEMERLGRLRSLDEWLMLAKEMKDAGVLFVLLTGGEPLLYPNFKELYLELLRLGMVITVNTNGTLIDDEWIDFFSQHKPRRINITLYGMEKEYKHLCHYQDGYDRAVKALRGLKEKGIAVKMNCSLAKANVDCVDDVFDVAEALDIPLFVDTYMCPAQRERERPFDFQSRLNPQEAARMRIHVLRREMGDEVFKESAKYNIALAENTPDGEAKRQGMKCKAGKCSFTINWQGEMRPCVIMDAPCVNVFEVGLMKAWQMIVEHSSQIYMSEECSVCQLRNVCNVCASYSLLEEGSYEKAPKYLCEYTKYTLQYFREELMKMENES